MNPSFWGSAAWDFLHQVPWLFPNEILSKKDSIDVLKFLHSFLNILACPTCSKDALDIEKKLNLLKSLIIPFNKNIMTRGKIAQYVYNLHNEVNLKLGYSFYGTNWRDSLKIRKKWAKNMFIFIFSVAWNYPKINADPEKKILYEKFFSIDLPLILKYNELGKIYSSYLLINPFDNNVMINRTTVFSWIYNLKISVSHICGDTWNFTDICDFLQAMEARLDCNVSNGCQ